ncbi:MAG: GIY-YIG nuclease family protein [Deltaproteobacteria bacterium]|nr:GIY-YIG nuclease family protein [Deltaproteobacteria bacterium]
MDNWWVYIVEKKTGLYVGITTDLENRMKQHGQPTPSYCEGPNSKAEALKGWSRKKKLELIDGIIQKHHGEIYAESEEGKGTTFTVRLPIKTASTP